MDFVLLLFYYNSIMFILFIYTYIFEILYLQQVTVIVIVIDFFVKKFIQL